MSYQSQEPLTWSSPVFRLEYVLLIIFIFCAVIFFFIFVLCLVWPLLPVSLDCLFLIVPSVFSNVYYQLFTGVKLRSIYRCTSTSSVVVITVVCVSSVEPERSLMLLQLVPLLTITFHMTNRNAYILQKKIIIIIRTFLIKES